MKGLNYYVKYSPRVPLLLLTVEKIKWHYELLPEGKVISPTSMFRDRDHTLKFLGSRAGHSITTVV